MNFPHCGALCGKNLFGYPLVEILPMPMIMPIKLLSPKPNDFSDNSSTSTHTTCQPPSPESMHMLTI